MIQAGKYQGSTATGKQEIWAHWQERIMTQIQKTHLRGKEEKEHDKDFGDESHRANGSSHFWEDQKLQRTGMV